jgi:hypothetical protein
MEAYMKKAVLILMVAMFSGSAFASTVVLPCGKIVEGKVTDGGGALTPKNASTVLTNTSK